MKLSKEVIEKLKAPSSTNRFVWDEAERGLGVRIADDNTKTFYFKGRVNGRQVLMRIGNFGTFTYQQARAEAQKIKGNIARGNDPADEHIHAQKGLPLSTVWEMFAKDRATNPYGRRRVWKTKTATEYGKIYRNNVGPALGHRPLASITDKDIEALRDKVKAGEQKTAREKTQRVHERGRTALADLVVMSLQGFFTWAIAKGYYKRANPAKGVGKVHKGKPRSRVLSSKELMAYMHAIASYEEGNVYAKAALRMYVLTACRREELLAVKWEHIDPDMSYLRIEDGKTGDRSISLTPDAVAILSALPRMPDNPYVFCGERRGRHLVNITKPFKRVLSMAGIDGVTIHDLRRSYGTFCLEAGVDIYTLSKLLGHASVTTTQRAYAFLPPEKLRQAQGAVGDHIANLISLPPASNVVSLKARKA